MTRIAIYLTSPMEAVGKCRSSTDSVRNRNSLIWRQKDWLILQNLLLNLTCSKRGLCPRTPGV